MDEAVSVTFLFEKIVRESVHQAFLCAVADGVEQLFSLVHIESFGLGEPYEGGQFVLVHIEELEHDLFVACHLPVLFFAAQILAYNHLSESGNEEEYGYVDEHEVKQGLAACYECAGDVCRYGQSANDVCKAGGVGYDRQYGEDDEQCDVADDEHKSVCRGREGQYNHFGYGLD